MLAGGGKIISIIAFAIFLSFFVSSKSSFYLIVFPIALLSALYSPIASVYGAPDYQSFVSLLATNFSEATEFLSLIPMKEYGKSLLIIVLALLCHLIAFKAKIKPWKNKTYVLLSCAFLVIALEPTLFVRKLYSAGEVTKEQLAELDKYSSKSSWQKQVSQPITFLSLARVLEKITFILTVIPLKIHRSWTITLQLR